MKKLIALAALILAPGIVGAADKTELNGLRKADVAAVETSVPAVLQQTGVEKIVGGVEAAKGEFPFIVSLQGSYGGHFCGGSLIKKDWVLTAAHCVPGGIKTVIAGLYDQSQTQGVEKFAVDKVIQHPDYNKQPQDWDFALVHLKGASKFTPVALNKTELTGNVDLVTAGWGYTEENGTIPNVLRKVTVPMVPAETCSAAYPGSITDRMICAGLDAGGKDSCQGDSGGPLIVGAGTQRALAGVVSWGEGCARPNKYGVYSKVTAALAWINGIVK